MRSDRYKAMLCKLPLGRFHDVVTSGGLVIVAPHQDDESLGCGGLISLARQQCIDVRIVFLTDGCGSHRHSRAYPPAALRCLRRAEALAAAGVLGLSPQDVTFLDLPDAHVPERGDVAETAADHILAIASGIAARSIFTTASCDPHRDHRAAHAIALCASRKIPDCRLWCYPIWTWHLDDAANVDLPEPRGYRLDIRAVLSRKRQAIDRHRSQMTNLIADDATGFVMSARQREPFERPWETFVWANA
jgi:LmbE family N-acetylglucosaminyl deacetylase